MSFIVAVIVLVLNSPGTVQEGPKNLDFEEGKVGGPPVEWINAGYRAKLVGDPVKSGKQAILMEGSGGTGIEGFGNLMQAFDAKPFRGKRVTYRASVSAHLQGPGNRAQLWMRVDRPNNKTGFFDNMSDRPIHAVEWRDYEITGDVADDAERITIGLLTFGRARVFFDAVSFEVVGTAGAGNERPRALEGRAAENLVAFAKLFGYVRHFHPSSESAVADWTSVAIAGVEAAESAKDAEELARVLEDFVRPFAPTVRVFVSGKMPELPPELSPPAEKTNVKVAAWKHRGVGINQGPGVYSSERAIRPLDADAVPQGMPDPAKPFVAELGGGVSCSVPLALFVDGDRTLPRVAAGAKPPATTKPKGFVPSGNDRSTRLAAAVIAWNYLEHFYPYFDVAPTDWPAALRTALDSAATDSDERAFLDTLRRMIVELRDGHGRVAHSSDTKIASLPLVWDWIEHQLVITHVIGDAKETVRPGDVVLEIDGRPAAAAIRAEEEFISGATPQWRRFRAVVELLGGDQGQDVTLRVKRGDAEPQAVTLKRSQRNGSVDEPRPEKVAELRPGFFYLDLDRISDADFRTALPKLDKATGVIFDLRGYPRQVSPVILQHLLDDGAQSAQWHVPLVTRPDRERLEFFAATRWNLTPLKPRLTARVAFISDGRAISYAESMLGIVEHYRLGAIVGGPTAGTNGNVNPFTLPGGYTVVWTGMKVLKHDGSQHHGVGIQPTVPVSRTIRGVRDGRDELLERAIIEVAK